VGVEAIVEVVHQLADALHLRGAGVLLLQLLEKEPAGGLAQHLVVGQAVAQVLGERGLAGAEEAGAPDADPLSPGPSAMAASSSQYWSSMRLVKTYSVSSL
jgi:hypothetical protein